MGIQCWARNSDKKNLNQKWVRSGDSKTIRWGVILNFLVHYANSSKHYTIDASLIRCANTSKHTFHLKPKTGGSLAMDDF